MEHFACLGLPTRRVKRPAALEGLAGLVIPGGESTCLYRLLRVFGMDQAIRHAYANGVKLWGTCAGAILLATENVGGAPFLALLDMAVERNAFGRQVDSFHTVADIPAVSDSPVPLTFIRAPKIRRVGKDVRVLLRLDDYVAAAETDEILVTVFHPELTPCLAFHRHFALKCGFSPEDIAPSLEADWRRTSWMRYARLAPVLPAG